MNKRYYILTFDKNDMSADKLHQVIVSLYNNGQIIYWWHYIKTCYLLSSNQNADTLAKTIGEQIQTNKRFFLVEINLNNRQGWLPQEAWKALEEL